VRGERERRAALPAPDHFGAEQRLLLAVCGLGTEVPAVRRHPRVQLSKDKVGAVSAEHLGRWHGREASRLIWIAENELARLNRSLSWVRAGDAAPLHRRLADPVLEAE